VGTRIASYIRRHHIALLALFIALAGTAWALERNTVKSKHIVNGQVKEADLATDSVTDAELADGAVPENQLILGQPSSALSPGTVALGQLVAPDVGQVLVVFEVGRAAQESAAAQVDCGVEVTQSLPQEDTIALPDLQILGGTGPAAGSTTARINGGGESLVFDATCSVGANGATLTPSVALIDLD
jgi:hypothetical protein